MCECLQTRTLFRRRLPEESGAAGPRDRERRGERQSDHQPTCRPATGRLRSRFESSGESPGCPVRRSLRRQPRSPRAGAKTVVCAHHSTKAAGKNICLETCLRGTGELGANADAVYYLEVKDTDSLRLRIHNVKARDFEPLKSIEVEGRPYIELTGDFRSV